MHLLITDRTDASLLKAFDQLILWASYDEAAFSNAVSIPLLVEKDSDQLRSRYLKLVYELGEMSVNNTTLCESLELRSGFSYWWMTLLVEKSNWAKSPSITDAIRLFAFDDWAKKQKHIKSVVLESTITLRACQSWCKQWG